MVSRGRLRVMSDDEPLDLATHSSAPDGLQDPRTGSLGAVLSEAMRSVELPERQRRIVTLVAKGYTSAEIARRLGISENTVANHRSAVLRRLGLRGSVGITHFAILAGLVDVGDVPGETGED